jgi:hypothetical protein
VYLVDNPDEDGAVERDIVMKTAVDPAAVSHHLLVHASWVDHLKNKKENEYPGQKPSVVENGAAVGDGLHFGDLELEWLELQNKTTTAWVSRNTESEPKNYESELSFAATSSASELDEDWSEEFHYLEKVAGGCCERSEKRDFQKNEGGADEDSPVGESEDQKGKECRVMLDLMKKARLPGHPPEKPVKKVSENTEKKVFRNTGCGWSCGDDKSYLFNKDCGKNCDWEFNSEFYREKKAAGHVTELVKKGRLRRH